MKFDHYAITSSSEGESDKFYVDLLGMEKKYKFHVPADLSYKILGLKEEFEVIRYGKDGVDVEIFITKKLKTVDKIKHLGLIVENREKIIDKATELGYNFNKIKKSNGKSYNIFIKDNSGNYFEIKE